MLNLNLYIHGSGCIAPAANDASENTMKHLAAEPDYTQWIPPMQLRRTSKAVRMGIGAAKMCMEAAGMERPDALSIGTAMGCLQDTEVFLKKMVTQEEKMLTPTSFIQSTHNTVGGQIALLMGCHGHNMTYVHRGHSFEHAIINAKLYLQDHPGETVLAGGIDELTDSSHLLMQRADFYTKNEQPGIAAGEGAAFFAVNEQASGALLKISALQLFITTDELEADARLEKFLLENQVLPENIGRLVIGANEATASHLLYDRLATTCSHAIVHPFKKISGEFGTASAIGLAWLVKEIAVSGGPAEGRILLINHYCDHYGLWLLEAMGR